ncbi:hypothetical protein HYH03_018643 [Edaphochlamys debaryana]|uniref:Uncharacterized protein n=1 Tax=Edaphochlamys debaryana TaxID=47281 RepID=A0A835XG43_9CHLO|nr:hypothetical protein HYH03_018643 [Edaphochlamys debaryana]|eukprot:KAG2482407.1 hypothetical protein HYH03_018643 [Edaphochlamys debaryana]
MSPQCSLEEAAPLLRAISLPLPHLTEASAASYAARPSSAASTDWLSAEYTSEVLLERKSYEGTVRAGKPRRSAAAAFVDAAPSTPVCTSASGAADAASGKTNGGSLKVAVVDVSSSGCGTGSGSWPLHILDAAAAAVAKGSAEMLDVSSAAAALLTISLPDAEDEFVAGAPQPCVGSAAEAAATDAAPADVAAAQGLGHLLPSLPIDMPAAPPATAAAAAPSSAGTNSACGSPIHGVVTDPGYAALVCGSGSHRGCESGSGFGSGSGGGYGLWPGGGSAAWRGIGGSNDGVDTSSVVAAAVGGGCGGVPLHPVLMEVVKELAAMRAEMGLGLGLGAGPGAGPMGPMGPAPGVPTPPPTRVSSISASGGILSGGRPQASAARATRLRRQSGPAHASATTASLGAAAAAAVQAAALASPSPRVCSAGAAAPMLTAAAADLGASPPVQRVPTGHRPHAGGGRAKRNASTRRSVG